MVMWLWELREHLDERGQSGESPYCSRKRGGNHPWRSWSGDVGEFEHGEDCNVPPGWRQFPNDLNEVEEQMADGCYFGIEELEAEVPMRDRSKVPSLGYHYVRNDNGDFVRVPDNPDFHVGAGEARVQTYVWFEMIVATVFETLVAMDYWKAREGVRQEPADPVQYERNLRLFQEIGRLDDVNIRRMTLSRATPDQVKLARDAVRNASDTACASGAARADGGPKRKRARKRSSVSSSTAAGTAAATLPKVVQSSSVVVSIRDNGVGDMCIKSSLPLSCCASLIRYSPVLNPWCRMLCLLRIIGLTSLYSGCKTSVTNLTRPRMKGV
jgi:hypothetical protein